MGFLFRPQDAIGDALHGKHRAVLTHNFHVPHMSGVARINESCLAIDLAMRGRHGNVGTAHFGTANLTIHVVRNMPRWEPGRQNGQRIETTFTLPISFKLQ